MQRKGGSKTDRTEEEVEWDAGMPAGMKQQHTWRDADQHGLLVRVRCIDLAWQDSWSKQQKGVAPQLKAGAVCWTCSLQLGAHISLSGELSDASPYLLQYLTKLNLFLYWGSWLSL